MEQSSTTGRSRRFRATGLLLTITVAVVSLVATYGTLMAAVAQNAHACCEQDAALTSCYTLCAAARSEASLGAAANWQPPVLAPTFGAELSIAIPTKAEHLPYAAPTGSSPPIYVRHAALLI